MDREGFVKLAFVAIGVIILGFFLRGFGQLLVGHDAAETVQAPFAVIGFSLVVYLSVRATLDWIGVWSIDATQE